VRLGMARARVARQGLALAGAGVATIH
jgi:hypothetical protein